MGRGKVRVHRPTGDQHARLRIQRNRCARTRLAATKVRGVFEGRAVCAQHGDERNRRHEPYLALKRIFRNRVIGRAGRTGEKRAATAVHGNGRRPIMATSTRTGCVQKRADLIQLGNERIRVPLLLAWT